MGLTSRVLFNEKVVKWNYFNKYCLMACWILL